MPSHLPSVGHRGKLVFGLAGLVAILLAASNASAGTFTWNTFAGVNSWGNGTNWLGGSPPTGTDNTDILIFGGGADYTANNDITSPFILNQLQFNNTATTVTIASSPATNVIRFAGTNPQLQQNNTSAVVISSPMDLSAGTTFGGSGSGNVSLTGQLTGSGLLTKTGTYSLILDNSTNLFFGNINMTGGTIQAGTTAAASSAALRSNSVSLGGGTLLNGGAADLRVGAISGSGTVNAGTSTIHIQTFGNASTDATVTASGSNGGINLRGLGTQTFNGNTTGIGGTIGVNSGPNFQLGGIGTTNGVIASTTIALRGGTVTLDNSGGNTSAATGRLSDTAAFTFLGGTFSLIGNSTGTTETVGTIALNSGAATISVTHNGGSGGTVLGFTDSGAIRDATGMTVNFVGNGGILGTAGSNPRITFSGALFTGTNTGLLSNANGSDASIGWALATTGGTTNWAGFDATNGIIALNNTLATDGAGINAAATTARLELQPSAATTSLVASKQLGVLKISPTASGQSLDLGTFNLGPQAVMLSGSNSFAITGTGQLFGGSASSTKYIHVVDPNAVLTVSSALLFNNSNPLTKGGEGFLFLNGTNQVVTTGSAANFNITQGTVRASLASLGGGTSSGGAFSQINLRGGVLEISGGGTFSRAADVAASASGGSVTFDSAVANRGDGGFSAIDGDLTVTLVTAVGGSTASNFVWNDGVFLANDYSLLFGSTQANSRVDFTNNIGLDNGTPGSYFARQVRVIDNSNSATDVARLSGVISGSSAGDFWKTGAGVLELTGNNTYGGNTIISQGTLLANNTAGSATGTTGSVIVQNGATLGGGNGAATTGFIGSNVNVLSGGHLAPGSSTGRLTINNNRTVTLSAGSFFDVEINGTNVTSQYDQLILTSGSSINLGSATLAGVVTGSYVPSDAVAIIWNQNTTGGVTGTFAGATMNGDTVTIGGYTAQIWYQGDFDGTVATIMGGNDIVLSNFQPVPEPAHILLLCGMLGGSGWLTRKWARRRNAVAC